MVRALMCLKSWLENQRKEKQKRVEDMDSDETGLMAWLSTLE